MRRVANPTLAQITRAANANPAFRQPALIPTLRGPLTPEQQAVLPNLLAAQDQSARQGQFSQNSGRMLNVSDTMPTLEQFSEEVDSAEERALKNLNPERLQPRQLPRIDPFAAQANQFTRGFAAKQKFPNYPENWGDFSKKETIPNYFATLPPAELKSEPKNWPVVENKKSSDVPFSQRSLSLYQPPRVPANRFDNSRMASITHQSNYDTVITNIEKILKQEKLGVAWETFLQKQLSRFQKLRFLRFDQDWDLVANKANEELNIVSIKRAPVSDSFKFKMSDFFANYEKMSLNFESYMENYKSDISGFVSNYEKQLDDTTSLIEKDYKSTIVPLKIEQTDFINFQQWQLAQITHPHLFLESSALLIESTLKTRNDDLIEYRNKIKSLVDFVNNSQEMRQMFTMIQYSNNKSLSLVDIDSSVQDLDREIKEYRGYFTMDYHFHMSRYKDMYLVDLDMKSKDLLPYAEKFSYYQEWSRLALEFLKRNFVSTSEIFKSAFKNLNYINVTCKDLAERFGTTISSRVESFSDNFDVGSKAKLIVEKVKELKTNMFDSLVESRLEVQNYKSYVKQSYEDFLLMMEVRLKQFQYGKTDRFSYVRERVDDRVDASVEYMNSLKNQLEEIKQKINDYKDDGADRLRQSLQKQQRVLSNRFEAAKDAVVNLVNVQVRMIVEQNRYDEVNNRIKQFTESVTKKMNDYGIERNPSDEYSKDLMRMDELVVKQSYNTILQRILEFLRNVKGYTQEAKDVFIEILSKLEYQKTSKQMIDEVRKLLKNLTQPNLRKIHDYAKSAKIKTIKTFNKFLDKLSEVVNKFDLNESYSKFVDRMNDTFGKFVKKTNVNVQNLSKELLVISESKTMSIYSQIMEDCKSFNSLQLAKDLSRLQLVLHFLIVTGYGFAVNGLIDYYDRVTNIESENIKYMAMAYNAEMISQHVEEKYKDLGEMENLKNAVNDELDKPVKDYLDSEKFGFLLYKMLKEAMTVKSQPLVHPNTLIHSSFKVDNDSMKAEVVTEDPNVKVDTVNAKSIRPKSKFEFEEIKQEVGEIVLDQVHTTVKEMDSDLPDKQDIQLLSIAINDDEAKVSVKELMDKQRELLEDYNQRMSRLTGGKWSGNVSKKLSIPDRKTDKRAKSTTEPSSGLVEIKPELWPMYHEEIGNFMPALMYYLFDYINEMKNGDHDSLVKMRREVGFDSSETEPARQLKVFQYVYNNFVGYEALKLPSVMTELMLKAFSEFIDNTFDSFVKIYLVNHPEEC